MPLGIVLFAAGLGWTAGPATSVVECSRRLERIAAGAARARIRILGRCITEATACPGAFDAEPARAPDGCSVAAGSRCRTRLDTLERFADRIARAGTACAARFDADVLLGDGLGYDAVAPLCPRIRLREGVVEDALVCQTAAAACTATAAVAVVAPRVVDWLRRGGASLGDAASCASSALCGNGMDDGDEECDDGPGNSDVEPDACRTTCMEAFCGDGVVDRDEECDDGNGRDGDGCDGDCELEPNACGNGVVDADEECDDQNHRDGDGCDEDCFVEPGTCGNGRVEDDEQCDDGNTDPRDGCDGDCQVREGICGNGLMEPDEECDDGAGNSDALPDHCRTDCTAPSCGDGILDPLHGEQCEPAGTLLCSSGCIPWHPPLPLDAGLAASLARCQRSLIATGTRAVVRSRTILGRCVQAIGRCVIVADADAACLDRARRSCALAASDRDRLIVRLTDAASRRCGRYAGTAVSVDALLRATAGLGFAPVAAACPFQGSEPPLVDDLVACVLARARCAGERLLGVTIPLAFDLLDTIDANPETRFPCIPDPDADGASVRERGPSPSGAFVDG